MGHHPRQNNSTSSNHQLEGSWAYQQNVCTKYLAKCQGFDGAFQLARAPLPGELRKSDPQHPTKTNPDWRLLPKPRPQTSTSKPTCVLLFGFFKANQKRVPPPPPQKKLNWCPKVRRTRRQARGHRKAGRSKKQHLSQEQPTAPATRTPKKGKTQPRLCGERC